MTIKPEDEVEIFPKMDTSRWGIAHSSRGIPEDVKAECSHWTVNLHYSSGEWGCVHAYFHGELPSDEDRYWINEQIAEFFNGQQE